MSAPWLLELLPSRSKWLVRTLARRRQVLPGAPSGVWQYLVSSFCLPRAFWNNFPAARSGSFGLWRASAKSCQGPLLGYGSTWSVALSAPRFLELLASRSKWLVRTLARKRQVLPGAPSGVWQYLVSSIVRPLAFGATPQPLEMARSDFGA